MNWIRLFTNKRNRNITFSLLGLAIGATAMSVARKRREDRTMFSTLRKWFR